MRNSSTALVLLVLAGSLASASPVVGPITNPANGHDYYLLEASMWTAAEAEAVSLGGHLVTIDDDAEHDWIYTTELGSAHRWIGFTDAAQEGDWVWISGEPVTYTNWLPGEPSGGQEDYAELDRNGWNDVTNDGWGVPHQGIVEVVVDGGALVTVCWDGNGDYLTIQEGIDAASGGDEVVLCEGTYAGDGNRDLDFGGKAITVRSTNPDDPDVVAATVIDCQGSLSNRHRGFRFHSGEDADSVVEGLTVRNGYAPLESTGSETSSAGGGIFCTGSGGYYGSSAQGSKPTIRNCIIEDNHADRYGGGIFCQYWSTATIANCVIRCNQTSSGSLNFGGGIYTWRRNALTITNCLFAGNLAGGKGGGLHYYDESPVTVVNCTFAGNMAGSSGGGINCSWNTTGATVENCILWGNSSPQIVANDAQWYATVSYSDVQGGFSGMGNIDADPPFVDPDGTDNDPDTWIDNDYRLQSGSPCIDSGDNTAVPASVTTDLDGNPRFVNDPHVIDTGNGTPPIVDMGAYEFSSDCNTNGILDTCDLDCGTNGGPCDVPRCGQSSDCNTNGIPDECDISGSTSLDCNDDEVPDECQLTGNDCNTNAVPDDCEPDFDGDGVIDDCDPDIDDDTVPNADDVCDYTPLGANIVTDPENRLYGTLRGDLDLDCDGDLEDYAIMQRDFTGPSNR